MRLIDADEFKKDYCEENCGKRQCRDAMDKCIFIDGLDNQPTAYDIDKVVKNLEESKKSIVGKYDSSIPILENASHKIAFNNGIDKAIEIVKAGGKNE